MKNSFLLIAILIAFFAVESSAQMNPFKAKEGFNVTLSKAQSSMTNPELLLVAIGNANTGTLPIAPDFNFDTGESTAWIYAFQESDQSLYKAYITVKIPLVGFQVTEIPFDQIAPMLPFQPKGKISSDNWVDSHEMIQTFRLESKVQEYLDGGNEPEIYFIGLFNVADNPILTNGRTYWIIVLHDNNIPLTCAMDAETKEVFCGIQLGDITSFTARQAYPAAKQHASENGLNEPQTLIVMTMKTGLEGIPFTNEFDFQAGTARYWLYHFREKDNPNKMAAFIVWNNGFDGYVIQEIDVDLVMELMPVSPIAPLEDENWPDSDYMINIFNQHQYFSDFLSEHPDPMSYVIGIFTNEDNPQLAPFEPYWGVSIVDDEITRDSIACVMHIESEEIICGKVLSNSENEQTKQMTLYPNPADNTINLKYIAYSHDTRISLISITGSEIFTISKNSNIGENIFRYDIQDIVNGNYYLKVQSGANVQAIPLIIMH